MGSNEQLRKVGFVTRSGQSKWRLTAKSVTTFQTGAHTIPESQLGLALEQVFSQRKYAEQVGERA